MKFRIESAGQRLSPSLKKYAELKLGKLNRYYKDIQEIEAILTSTIKSGRETISCVLNLRVPGKDINIRSSSVIFEDAILKSADSAKRKLRKRKTQLQAARRKKSPNRKVSASKALK
ncbi:MAG: HPF/RaiA family ribosome-associated protein [Bacteroidia bacterium]|nr:HPF/RaiA family ribosome-associated protein [Bacteroidia bacterium]MCZ2278213.1 HPF/RaiA family ribosome-associated protein [Bacteroidia bacterium]